MKERDEAAGGSAPAAPAPQPAGAN